MPRALSQPSSDASCAVCASSDRRSLTTTPLASGALVVVCGSHAVAHARVDGAARSVAELRAMLGERRDRHRRGDSADEVDELARSLSAGFCPERRRVDRRGLDA